MTSKESGLMAKTRRAGDLHTLTFEQLLNQFKRDIEWYASRYPKSWKDHFCQEGAMALFAAYQKFIILPPERDFRSYALTAIDHRMVDFYRKTIERAPIIKEEIFTDDDGEETDYIYNVTDDVNFFSTMTFDIDYQIIFNEDNLRTCGFTDTEVKAIEMHLVNDLPVWQVAKELNVSAGRASQIIASSKKKSQELLKYYYKN